MKVRTLGVIPSRFGAQRFPGKPLVKIAGKSLVQRVYEQARQASRLDDIVVATDDTRILEAVENFGGTAMLTSVDCPSGTDRAAEVAKDYSCDLVVNIQGDEPLIKPNIIDLLISNMTTHATYVMGTLASRLYSPDALADPDNVKVTFDVAGKALDFSRQIIPAVSDVDGGLIAGMFHKHIGIYAYRKDFLLQFVKLPQTQREVSEGLEQLRALDNGCPIGVWVTEYDTISVDRPDDIQKVEAQITKLA